MQYIQLAYAVINYAQCSSLEKILLCASLFYCLRGFVLVLFLHILQIIYLPSGTFHAGLARCCLQNILPSSFCSLVGLNRLKTFQFTTRTSQPNRDPACLYQRQYLTRKQIGMHSSSTSWARLVQRLGTKPRGCIQIYRGSYPSVCGF